MDVRGVRNVEEFAAWQLAEAFKSEVFALLKGFCRFLDYALGSLREAEGWIQDGIEFGYFRKERCQRAFWFGERCFTATLRLKHSQERYAEQLERERRARSKLNKADRNQVPRTLYEAAGESKIDFFVMKPHVQ